MRKPVSGKAARSVSSAMLSIVLVLGMVPTEALAGVSETVGAELSEASSDDDAGTVDDASASDDGSGSGSGDDASASDGDSSGESASDDDAGSGGTASGSGDDVSADAGSASAESDGTSASDSPDAIGTASGDGSASDEVGDGSDSSTGDAGAMDGERAELDALAAENSSVIEDGQYAIIAASDGERALSGSGTTVSLGAVMDDAAQVWTVSHDEDGYVVLVNDSTGLALDVTGASTDIRTKVQLHESNGTYAQKWIAIEDGDGIELVSALGAGLVLDLPSGATSVGIIPQIYTDNGTIAQRWTFASVDETLASLDELAAANADAIEDGTYAILNNKSGRGVLDVASGSTSAKANIQLYGSNGTEAQLWEVTHDEDGYVTFTCVKSGMVIDASGGTAAVGTNIWQYGSNGSLAQKWVVVPDDLGGYTIYSALWTDRVLDLATGTTTDGTNIQLYRANGTEAQSFVFVSTDVDEPDPCSELSSLDEGSWYTLEPGCASGLCLDVVSGSLSDGANVQLYENKGALAQLFCFEFVDDGSGEGTGYYMIFNASSGMALAVRNGDVISGANVAQYEADETDDAQLWSAQVGDDGSMTFVNKASALALDISGGSSSDGANVQGYTPNGTAAQSFVALEQTDLLAEKTYTISAASDTSCVLDVTGGSVSGGTSIQLYRSNSTLAQKWYVSKVDGYDNTYTIESVVSGKCLTAEDGDLVQRASDGGKDQMWIPSITTDGVTFVNKSSGKAIDIEDGDIESGTNVQMYRSNGTAAQQFRLTTTGITLSSGIYRIYMASTSSKVIEVKDGSVKDGANVQLNALSSSAGYQKWKVTRNSDGTYTVVNCWSGKALDVKGGSAEWSTTVQQSTSTKAKRQKWYISYAGGGFKLISALDSSVALDLSNASSSNGTNVQIYRDKGGVGQRFAFESTSYGSIPGYTAGMSSDELAMYEKAQGYSSSTKYLILVNTTTNKVGIYKGSKGDWDEAKYWSCSTGASSTPTVKGTFTVKSKGYSFGSGYTCYYYTQFYGNYLFHSVLYYEDTFTVKDGRLGMNISHGCVRLALDNAKWIYNNIPIGTKVVIY